MIDVELNAELPLAGVRRVCAWTFTELDIDDVLVRVFHDDHWYHHGHFYVRPASAFPLRILAYIPREISGDGHDRGLRGGPPPIYPVCWQESLVCILAHEGTHYRQYMNGPQTPGYSQSRNGKVVHVTGRIFTEVDAEWAEYRFLKRWRERRKS